MTNKFLDLEQIVKDWAWTQYDESATRTQRRLRNKEKKSNAQKYVSVVIDWSDVKFRDETKWQRVADDADSESAQGATGTSSTGAHALQASAQAHGRASSAAPQASVLFQTKFTNNTKDGQEYTMRTEKTTRSSMSTTVENGFTKGFDMSIKLMTPCEVFEANAGYHREVSLTNCEGETFEEELTWGVESVIHVQAEHIAEARLVVDERKQVGMFEIESRIRGWVYVTFNNVRDNNSFLTTCGDDICNIVSRHLEKERRKGSNMEHVRIENPSSTEPVLIVVTKGTCKFRYGIKQEVRVDQKPINSAQL